MAFMALPIRDSDTSLRVIRRPGLHGESRPLAALKALRPRPRSAAAVVVDVHVEEARRRHAPDQARPGEGWPSSLFAAAASAASAAAAAAAAAVAAGAKIAAPRWVEDVRGGVA